MIGPHANDHPDDLPERRIRDVHHVAGRTTGAGRSRLLTGRRRWSIRQRASHEERGNEERQRQRTTETHGHYYASIIMEP